MISSLLHLVGLRPRVYYTLTNFRGGGARPPCPPPPQYANAISTSIVQLILQYSTVNTTVGSLGMVTISSGALYFIAHISPKGCPTLYSELPEDKTFMNPIAQN